MANDGTLVGTIFNAGSNQIYSNLFQANSNSVTLKGNENDNNNGVAIKLDNPTALTVAGSVHTSFRNAGTEFGYVNPNGVSSLWTSHPVTGSGKRLGKLTIDTTADITFNNEGMGAPTYAGVPAAAPAQDSSMMMIDFPTLAVSNDVAGFKGPYTSTRFDYRPRFTATIRTGSSIADQRIFIGLSNADISGVATLAGLNSNKVIALRYDTGLSDTTWYWVTSNGSTAVAGAMDVSVAINTTYVMDIDFTRSGGVVFRINNEIINTNQIPTATLPSGTTDIGVQASVTTLTTAVKHLYIAKVTLEQN